MQQRRGERGELLSSRKMQPQPKNCSQRDAPSSLSWSSSDDMGSFYGIWMSGRLEKRGRGWEQPEISGDAGEPYA